MGVCYAVRARRSNVTIASRIHEPIAPGTNVEQAPVKNARDDEHS
jgi:hypothetical protein